MKTKWMVLVVTMLFALAMMAQTATQTAPAAPATGDKASSCACCNHDMAGMKPGDKCPMMKDGKMADGKSCCGEGCCKDGKCQMADNKDGKSCCSGGKCAMMSKGDAKGGCCGDKCPMMKKGEKSAAKLSGKADNCCKTTAKVSCCRPGAACCKGGYMPCCSRDQTAV